MLFGINTKKIDCLTTTNQKQKTNHKKMFSTPFVKKKYGEQTRIGCLTTTNLY